MAKKRLVRSKVNHRAELKHEETMFAKPKRKRNRSFKPKRPVLRYRRNMRIGGVIAKNKGEAKKLFQEKLQKRSREMEWEAPAESRPKKRRMATDQEERIFPITTMTDGAERFDHLVQN